MDTVSCVVAVILGIRGGLQLKSLRSLKIITLLAVVHCRKYYECTSIHPSILVKKDTGALSGMVSDLLYISTGDHSECIKLLFVIL